MTDGKAIYRITYCDERDQEIATIEAGEADKAAIPLDAQHLRVARGGPPGAVLVIPEDQLAGEIECALAYVLACNPPVYEVLTRRRGELCEAMARMISERAGNGLSGMSAG